jgi:hypothetical protein
MENIALDQGWRTYGTHQSLLSWIFYFYCPTSVSIFWRMCVYADISDCVEVVYEVPLLPNKYASETFWHKSVAAQSGDWVFIAGAPAIGQTFDNGENVLHCSFQTGSSSSPRCFHVFFLIVFLEDTFTRYVLHCALIIYYAWIIMR